MKSIFLILLCFMVFSCSKSTENKKNLSTVIINTQSSGQSGIDQPGKALYKKYCLTCHQLNGTGVPGMFPPLGPGSWVSKDPNDLILLILKGLNGEIEVNGERFKNVMPLQDKITDQELADVLTYVRSNFGNNFKPVTPDMVKKVRAGL